MKPFLKYFVFLTLFLLPGKSLAQFTDGPIFGLGARARATITQGTTGSGGFTTITGGIWTVDIPYLTYPTNPAETSLRDSVYDSINNIGMDNTSLAYATIDFGSSKNVREIVYVCLSTSAPLGPWGCAYSNNRDIEYSANCSSGWTLAGTTGGSLSENTVYTISVNFNARCVRISNDTNYTSFGDFYFRE